MAWLGFELLTSMLEVESANHYTMDPSWWINNFLKYHKIKMISFVLCNIFERIWYSECILVKFPFNLTLFNLWSDPVCSIGCTPIKFQNPILVKTNKHFSYQSNPGGGFYPSRRSSLATGSISDLAKPTNWVFVLPYLLVHLSILMCN